MTSTALCIHVCLPSVYRMIQDGIEFYMLHCSCCSSYCNSHVGLYPANRRVTPSGMAVSGEGQPATNVNSNGLGSDLGFYGLSTGSGLAMFATGLQGAAKNRGTKRPLPERKDSQVAPVTGQAPRNSTSSSKSSSDDPYAFPSDPEPSTIRSPTTVIGGTQPFPNLSQALASLVARNKVSTTRATSTATSKTMTVSPHTTTPMARLYPELAEKLDLGKSKSQPMAFSQQLALRLSGGNQEKGQGNTAPNSPGTGVMTSSTSVKAAENKNSSMNRLQTKIAQNKIKDKLKRNHSGAKVQEDTVIPSPKLQSKLLTLGSIGSVSCPTDIPEKPQVPKPAPKKTNSRGGRSRNIVTSTTKNPETPTASKTKQSKRISTRQKGRTAGDKCPSQPPSQDNVGLGKVCVFNLAVPTTVSLGTLGPGIGTNNVAAPVPAKQCFSTAGLGANLKCTTTPGLKPSSSPTSNNIAPLATLSQDRPLSSQAYAQDRWMASSQVAVIPAVTPTAVTTISLPVFPSLPVQTSASSARSDPLVTVHNNVSTMDGLQFPPNVQSTSIKEGPVLPANYPMPFSNSATSNITKDRLQELMPPPPPYNFHHQVSPRQPVSKHNVLQKSPRAMSDVVTIPSVTVPVPSAIRSLPQPLLLNTQAQSQIPPNVVAPTPAQAPIMTALPTPAPATTPTVAPADLKPPRLTLKVSPRYYRPDYTEQGLRQKLKRHSAMEVCLARMKRKKNNFNIIPMGKVKFLETSGSKIRQYINKQ